MPLYFVAVVLIGAGIWDHFRIRFSLISVGFGLLVIVALAIFGIAIDKGK